MPKMHARVEKRLLVPVLALNHFHLVLITVLTSLALITEITEKVPESTKNNQCCFGYSSVVFG